MENIPILANKNNGLTQAGGATKRGIASARRITALPPRRSWIVTLRDEKNEPRQFIAADDFRFRREMRRIRARLRELVTPPEVDRWLHAPNKNLNGLTPAAAVAQGKTSLVLEMIATVEEGIYV